jgi:hypothetical protein
MNSDIIAWESLSSIRESVIAKLNDYESFDICVPNWEELKLHRAVFEWISSARTTLIFIDWENVSEADIFALVRDVLYLSKKGYTLDSFAHRVKEEYSFVHCYLEVVGDFVELVMKMKKSLANIEKMHTRRVTRKKSDMTHEEQVSDKMEFHVDDLYTGDDFSSQSGIDIAENFDDVEEFESCVAEADNKAASTSKRSRRSEVSRSSDSRKSSSKEHSTFRHFQTTDALPDTLCRLLDFWLLLLFLHYGRAAEAKSWLADVLKVKNLALSSSENRQNENKVDNSYDDLLRNMLERAVQRNLPKSYRYKRKQHKTFKNIFSKSNDNY